MAIPVSCLPLQLPVYEAVTTAAMATAAVMGICFYLLFYKTPLLSIVDADVQFSLLIQSQVNPGSF